MEHRIRSAAIVVDNDGVLLVKHQVPGNGEVWWVTPGGGIEGTESIFECACRETYEETGLTVHLDRVVYLREFIWTARQVHHFEVFILCADFAGALTTANIVGKGPDEAYIKEARFQTRREMQELAVQPEELKDEFWDDLERGFPGVRYLGLRQA